MSNSILEYLMDIDDFRDNINRIIYFKNKDKEDFIHIGHKHVISPWDRISFPKPEEFFRIMYKRNFFPMEYREYNNHNSYTFEFQKNFPKNNVLKIKFVPNSVTENHIKELLKSLEPRFYFGTLDEIGYEFYFSGYGGTAEVRYMLPDEDINSYLVSMVFLEDIAEVKRIR